jgi:hypothetical protein
MIGLSSSVLSSSRRTPARPMDTRARIRLAGMPQKPDEGMREVGEVDAEVVRLLRAAYEQNPLRNRGRMTAARYR